MCIATDKEVGASDRRRRENAPRQDRPQDYVDQTSDNDAEVQIYLPDNGRDD